MRRRFVRPGFECLDRAVPSLAEPADTVTAMRRVWLIRAGDSATEIDPMRLAGQIGLRYEMIGNVRDVTPAQIDQAIIDSGQMIGVAASRSTLMLFVTDIRPGDLVVSPNPKRHEVWVGAVSGDYEYTESPRVAGFQHTRAVEWKGWLDRSAPWIKDQLKSLDRPGIMYELPGREWWWHQVDNRDFAVSPRLSMAKVPAERTPRTRAARPSTSTRKPPVPMVRCAGGCGFQWAPTSLVGGLCTDCRADL